MIVRHSASVGAACAAAFALALAGAPALADSHMEGESGAGMEESTPGAGMDMEGEPGTGTHEGTEKGATDDVAKKVSEKLESEEGLAGVHAMAEEGTITLRGTVAKSADRERAEELASNIEGVDSVRNEIEIDVASPPAEGASGY